MPCVRLVNACTPRSGNILWSTENHDVVMVSYGIKRHIWRKLSLSKVVHWKPDSTCIGQSFLMLLKHLIHSIKRGIYLNFWLAAGCQAELVLRDTFRPNSLIWFLEENETENGELRKLGCQVSKASQSEAVGRYSAWHITHRDWSPLDLPPWPRNGTTFVCKPCGAGTSQVRSSWVFMFVDGRDLALFARDETLKLPKP